jgi:hypothetical protein
MRDVRHARTSSGGVRHRKRATPERDALPCDNADPPELIRQSVLAEESVERIRDRTIAVAYRLVSWLFAGAAVREAVTTQVCLNASPETVWNQLMFYEDIPGRPAPLLRALLPDPVRSEGNKTRAGAAVRCIYRGGDLTKRITTVERPHLLQFDVIEQRLGIEGCVLTLGGSYQLHSCGSRTHLTLITHYQAYLRPRSLWRPLEALLASQLHGHILHGVCAAVPPRDPAISQTITESATPWGA